MIIVVETDISVSITVVLMSSNTNVQDLYCFIGNFMMYMTSHLRLLSLSKLLRLLFEIKENTCMC